MFTIYCLQQHSEAHAGKKWSYEMFCLNEYLRTAWLHCLQRNCYHGLAYDWIAWSKIRAVQTLIVNPKRCSGSPTCALFSCTNYFTCPGGMKSRRNELELGDALQSKQYMSGPEAHETMLYPVQLLMFVFRSNRHNVCPSSVSTCLTHSYTSLHILKLLLVRSNHSSK